MNNFEEEYNEKLKQAKIEDNPDKMTILFFELKVLRKKFSKSIIENVKI